MIKEAYPDILSYCGHCPLMFWVCSLLAQEATLVPVASRSLTLSLRQPLLDSAAALSVPVTARRGAVAVTVIKLYM